MKLTVIVIAKNEAWKLDLSLKSIFVALQKANCDYEVIYVDSASTDNNIEIAKRCNVTSIYLLTDNCNSAIARNVGACEASGDLLFFVDGDMEIDPAFIKRILNLDWKNKYDYVTGHIDDYYYDYEDNYLNFNPRTYKNHIPKSEEYLITNGGAFVIKKELWEKVGGMNTKYKRSQDLDLSLRLSENNVKIVRIPVFMAKHHTIAYVNEKRIWKNTFDGYVFYSAMLFRDHFFKLSAWKRMIRSQYTLFVSLGILIITITLKLNTLLSILFFLFLHMIRSYKVTKSKNHLTIFNFFNKAINQIVSDGMFLIGFFFFKPERLVQKFRKL